MLFRYSFIFISEYGFNVQEAQVLEKMGAYTKTGADEIPLSLLSRAIQGEIKICPKFLEPESKNLISNYEDVSIEKSVLGQIELAGCKITDEENFQERKKGPEVREGICQSMRQDRHFKTFITRVKHLKR